MEWTDGTDIRRQHVQRRRCGFRATMASAGARIEPSAASAAASSDLPVTLVQRLTAASRAAERRLQRRLR